jgi:hypothetical protein
VPLPTGQDVLTEVGEADARPGHRDRGRHLDLGACPPVFAVARCRTSLFVFEPPGKQGHAAGSPLLGHRAASQTMVLTRHQATDRSQPPLAIGDRCACLSAAGSTSADRREFLATAVAAVPLLSHVNGVSSNFQPGRTNSSWEIALTLILPLTDIKNENAVVTGGEGEKLNSRWKRVECAAGVVLPVRQP